MLVVLLILFTNVLCDSDEDKYVDLLPDAEKQQFIEKVARRILEDVESKENRAQKSTELSDEQLRKHNEYVKAILKEESENIRRSKGEGTKVRAEEKEGKEASEETLGVKPLENEKIADDPDLEQVDLTLRNDRRDINPLDNSTDFIKVEIISDEPPIIKRSVRNKSFSESESDEATTYASETTTGGTEISTVQSELTDATTKLDNGTYRSHSNENINPKSETENPVEPKANLSVAGLDHTDKTQNELTAAVDTVKNKVDSTESDGEDILVTKKTRRAGENNTTEKTNGSLINVETVHFGAKLPENASSENHITTTSDVEETTVTTEAPDTTTDMTSTTQDIDAATVLSTATVFNLPDDKKNDSGVEMLSDNSLPSTLSDERTTDSVIDTTTSKTDTETPTTDYIIQTRTEYLTDSPVSAVATTEGMKIEVEDFTSAPKTEKTVKDPTTTTEKTTKSETNLKVTFKIEKVSSESTEATTKKTKDKNNESTKNSKKPIKKATAKDLTTTVKPKSTVKTKVKNNLSYDFKQIKSDEVDSADKNFIELEKVYYNKIKGKGTKEYEVYEIPPNKPPFVQVGEPVTEQPYYVPVYNYSPNNAYFNPQNRLGPNADDDDTQVSAFGVEENVNNFVLKENIKEMSSVTNNVDMEYSESVFQNQRKKFGNKQKLFHSIHKKPAQNDSPEQKRGKVNLDDYVDSDYYFGRIRKDSENSDKHNHLDQFPNSNENVHPFHSIPEMNLKDHVRAVRNILFQQKFFGTSPKEESSEVKNKLTKTPERFGSHPFRKGENERRVRNDNNIAIDYYFGRMKKPTMVEFTSKKEKSEPRLERVGYIKNENDTKGLFMIDQFFKDNVINYIHELKSKGDTYIKADLLPVTPLPILVSDKIPVAHKPTVDSKFRNLEKVRNAELNHIANTPDVDTIKKVINVANDQDLFTKLKKLQQSKMNDRDKKQDDTRVSAYLTVLKDMLNADNMALKQYDWLGTTVDIQASFQKLFELVSVVFNGERIHPADLEILKYMIFLHKLGREIIEANDLGNQLRYNYVLPKNKRQKKRIIKEKGLLNRVWLYLRRKVPEVHETEVLKNFNVFLMDVEDNLYDLHDAIKSIAKITKYRNQHWYQNLKELYLSNDEKRLLELLLHMCVSRLFGLVEESAKNGMEDDYIGYMKENKAEAKKTLEEMLFVMQIVDEIKHLE